MNRSLVIIGMLITAAWFRYDHSSGAYAQSTYDPLAVPNRSTSPANEPIELTVDDTKRQRRLPIRVYLPVDKGAAPVVMFSHGLGGSREGASYLGRHWSSRGYVVVFLQHPGSDEAVWRDSPLRQRMTALKNAASVQNFQDRVDDVRVTIDRLGKWNAVDQGPLTGRLDLERLGMSGHSFGAVTTQAVSGQRHLAGGKFGDERIKAAVIMSPSGPRNGLMSAERAFGDVRIPWMLMTGTRDEAPIGDMTPRNPQHWNTILALSTAFWDAYLREDNDAKQWLLGKDPQSVLSPSDRWQKK